MNQARRKALAAIERQLTTLRQDIESAADAAEEIRHNLEDITSEEQEALDAMPDSLKEGERGQKSQAAIDALEEAIGILADFLTGTELEEVAALIEQAAE